MKTILTFALLLLFSQFCFGQAKDQQSPERKARQDAIVKQYATNGAHKLSYTNQNIEWQKFLDEGLAQDSTIAYLWQQKSMPYFKAGKHEVGMGYLDKAVALDPDKWLPYRAFIKCIFVGAYRDAIADFEECKKRYGNSFVMDHSYDFYMGLSYLQLEDFARAEALFAKNIKDIAEQRGEDWQHPTVLFYYGITKFEQRRLEEAIAVFDRALKIYPRFSDAKVYKSLCLEFLNHPEESRKLYLEAQADAKEGYTLNEDNAQYERYPYQKRWNWHIKR